MMKSYVALTALFFVLIGNALQAQTAVLPLPNFNEADCEAKTINLKVKDQYRNLCNAAGINNAALNGYLTTIGGTTQLLFPNAKQPDKKLYEQVEKPADITLVYRIKYTANIPLRKVINSLNATGLFVYAEPNYIMQKCYSVNDPNANSQWYIGQLKANLAWDVWKGDTNMVIGITDSGVDTNHTDLKPNIKYNYADPYNGIDDDNDGYIDNKRGWNIWANSNNVYDAQDSHGTYVTGISSAKTDNSIGIAGLGFKCKFLPVRVDDNHGSYIRCYEAVVYAADHGCKVINCSWGSHYASNFGIDVMNYAVINKDAVVVAAAGNDNSAQPTFPASYQYVLSIGGLQQSNAKANSSSWGAFVDMVAYGSGVYSTYNPNTYTTSGGTSASAPMVSAAAALVRSYNPTWSALKVAEQVKVTSNPAFYSVPSNSAYANKLGRGLLDMQKALTDTTSPSVVMLDKRITDNNDGNFYPGDTLRLSGIFKNYIRPATGLSVTVSCTSPYITLLNNTFLLGNLNQNDTISNRNLPFKAVIANNTPIYTPVEFKFTISGTNYTGLEYMLDTLNRKGVNIDIGNVVMTVPANGAIGFNGNSSTGYGFTYKDSGPLFYSSGLLIGQAGSPNKVMDNTYGATAPNYDADYTALQPTKQRAISLTSGKDVYGKFDDSAAGSGRINVTVEHRGFGWAGLNEKFVILEYCIRPNGQNLNNIVAGVFADWDILTYYTGNGTVFHNDNVITTDAARKLIYCNSTAAQSIYAGVRLLTMQNANYYAFNSDGTGGSANIYDGFTTDEKYNTTSGNLTRQSATVGDVAATLGVGPVNIAAADSFKFAVAFVAGDNLADMQAQSDSAYARYWRWKWTGYQNTDWNTSANWNWYRIPTDTNDVLIPANPIHLPNVGNYDGYSRNLAVIDPSTISQTGANSALTIKGNLYSTGNGGINANQGAVNFNGTTPQTISGINTIHQINIINPQGVTNNPNAVLTINGPLNIQQGDFTNKGTLNKE